MPPKKTIIRKPTNKSSKPSPKKICSICEKEMALTEFYNANPMLHLYGKAPFCKECSFLFIGDNVENLKKILQVMDKPFIVSMFDSCKDLPDYFRQLNSLPQYKGQTYQDSTVNVDSLSRSESKQKEIVQNHEIANSTLDIDAEARKRWAGYTDDEIRMLEPHFQDLIADFECDTVIQQSLYKNIAITQMKASQAINQGDISNYDRLMKILSSLYTDGKLKPNQRSASEKSGGVSSFGEFVALCERDGFIEMWPKVPRDDIDFMEQDMRNYLRNLVLGESNLQQMVEADLKKIKEKENNGDEDIEVDEDDITTEIIDGFDG